MALGPDVLDGGDGEGARREASELDDVGNSTAVMVGPVFAGGYGGGVEGHTAPDLAGSREATASSVSGPGVGGGVAPM